MKVYMDASCNILYASYYIKGLHDLFGARVKFAYRPFANLDHKGQFLAIQIIKGSTKNNIIIDFGNSRDIYPKALLWCHVYGKINLAKEDQNIEKVVPIGPSMAIRIYGFWNTFFFSIGNYLKAYKKIDKPRAFFAMYKAQYRVRQWYDDYKYENAEPAYIFFSSSLWKKEHTYNRMRSNFITTCKSIEGLKFEGGFSPRSKNDVEGYEKNTMPKRLPIDVYMANMRKSCIVFHTPSVRDCNGWRLAEYLSMGKAILTTPLKRLLPPPFIRGEHYLETDGSQGDLEEKIKLLLHNTSLRIKLQKNATQYFRDHLEPQKVILKLTKNI